MNIILPFISNKKVEIYFLAIVGIALLPIDSILRSIILLFLTGLFHIKNRPVLLVVIVGLFVCANIFSAFIVDKRLKKDGSYTYYTITGTIEGADLKTGDILIGSFENISTGYFKQYRITNEAMRVRLPFYSALMELRDRNIEQLYFLSDKKVVLLPAIFYGDKRYINDQLNELFTITGLNHLLAISGQHVALILTILFVVMYKLQIKIRFIVASIIIFLFVPLAGFQIPVVRAVAFILIITLAYLLDRKVMLNKLVLWVAAIFIAIDPDIIHNPSFCLSFLAVMGIALVQKEDVRNPLMASLLIGLYATSFTLPYVVYKFGMFNIFSILNTILYSPVVSLMIAIGMVSVFSPSFVIPLEIVVEKLSISYLELLTTLTNFGFVLTSISSYIFACSLIIIAICYFWRKGVASMAVFFILLVPQTYKEGIYFPALKRSEGYIINYNGINEVYFKGTGSDFRYNFLPFIARTTGTRKFEFGDIILPYESRFIRIEKRESFSGTVCFNKNGCNVVMLTNKRSLKKIDLLKNVLYISYLDGADEGWIDPNKYGGYEVAIKQSAK